MTTPPGKPLGRSVALAAEKGRLLRLQRIHAATEQRLDNAIPVLDALLAEAAEGEKHDEVWEKIHIAAMKSGTEAELADAYVKTIAGARMKRLPAQAQVDVLMHAADFFQGVRGDAAAAAGHLEKVLAVMPGHRDAFTRLERRLETLRDSFRLVELYASVAAAPPTAVATLATQALNRLLLLGPKDVVPDAACRALLAIASVNPKLLDALDAHCRKTKRPGLACELIEQTLLDEALPGALRVERRHRLIKLYLGEAASPAKAIDHVEALLTGNPTDAEAFKAGERLVATPQVASRAAAILTVARRSRA